jgi:hypothetical protein
MQTCITQLADFMTSGNPFYQTVDNL